MLNSMNRWIFHWQLLYSDSHNPQLSKYHKQWLQVISWNHCSANSNLSSQVVSARPHIAWIVSDSHECDKIQVMYGLLFSFPTLSTEGGLIHNPIFSLKAFTSFWAHIEVIPCNCYSAVLKPPPLVFPFIHQKPQYTFTPLLYTHRKVCDNWKWYCSAVLIPTTAHQKIPVLPHMGRTDKPLFYVCLCVQ